MSRKVEFFFDVVSPYSYVAAVQVARSPLLQEVEWRPFLLGGVFKATGNQAPIAVPAKGQYMAQDLQRLFAYYAMPYRFPGSFPTSSLTAMRALCAAAPTQVKDLAPTQAMILNDPSRVGPWLTQDQIAFYQAMYDRDVGFK